MTTENPLPCTVPPPLYWIKLQFMQESIWTLLSYLMHWKTLCNRTHPTCNLVKSITRFTWKHTPREDMCSTGCVLREDYGAPNSALARQWTTLSQLPPYCLFQYPWALSGSRCQREQQVIGQHLLVNEASWDPRSLASLHRIRQIFRYTVSNKCLYQKLALQF